jgi:glycosyltransferase involved in cell wall biosynthesis
VLNGCKVELHLYIVRASNGFLKKMLKFYNVYCYPPIKHADVPRFIHKYDLLLLPLAFTQKGTKYAKYSMPTKMSEYMISGVPILVFAPSDCAVTKYANENKIAFTCSENNLESVIQCLKKIMSENIVRKEIVKNAVEVAIKNHEINKENERFRNLLNIL